MVSISKKRTLLLQLLFVTSIGANIAAGIFIVKDGASQSECTVFRAPSPLIIRSALIASNITNRSSVSTSNPVGGRVAIPKPVAANAVEERPAAELIQQTLDALGAEGERELENPLAIWRRKFMQDAPDSIWSKMAESQTKSSLGSVLGREFELVGVSCGSRVCEIRAATTSSTDNSENAANNWQADIAALSTESWWKTYGFASPNSAIWRAPDDRILFVSYLIRNDELSSVNDN